MAVATRRCIRVRSSSRVADRFRKQIASITVAIESSQRERKDNPMNTQGPRYHVNRHHRFREPNTSSMISDSVVMSGLCLLFIHPRAPNLISLRSAGTMPA